MFKYKNVVVVVNTHSRAGKKNFSQTKSILKQNNITVSHYHKIRKPSKIDKVMMQIMKDKVDLLILGGGDGTISTVVDYLAYKDTVLGLLPLGTSNSFVRSLKIPLDLNEAINVIIKGKTKKVDLGMINNDYFANTANIGLSALIAKNVSREIKRKFGRMGYIMAGFYHFMKHVAFDVIIITDKEKLSFKALEIIIANGRYQNGVRIAPTSDVANNNITLMVVKGEDKMDLIKLWTRALLKKSIDLKNVVTLTNQNFYIETFPHKRVDVDGEITTKTPIKVSVASQSLKVRVPQK